MIRVGHSRIRILFFICKAKLSRVSSADELFVATSPFHECLTPREVSSKDSAITCSRLVSSNITKHITKSSQIPIAELLVR